MNLEEFSRNTAEKFISNVLVIDDKFNYESTEISKDITTPDEFDLTPEDIQSASPQESSLNAIKLIQAFANKNIHCTPFLFTTTIPYGLINKSDILILDWELPSVNCCDIIKEIVVKLIGKTQSLFIYTNKKKEEVIKSLSECNFDNISSVCNNDIFLFSEKNKNFPFLQICIISKNEYSEELLPTRIIELFSSFTKGFLANQMLAIIAEIKSKSYNFVGLYNNVDKALVTHYLNLLCSKDVCEQADINCLNYITDILASDIKDLLENNKNTIDLSFLADFLSDCKFYADGQECHTKGEKTLKSILIDPNPTEDTFESIYSDMNGKNNLKKILSISAQDDDNKLLAYIDCVKKDFDLKSEHKINYGSILKKDSNYYLCLEPKCDCERLKQDTSFLFIKLTENEQKFDFVIKDQNFIKTLIIPENMSASLCSITFSPCPTSKNIMTDTDSKITTVDGKEYTWICQLKDVYVQKNIYKIFGNYSRVGFDQFEWLRKKNNRQKF